MRLSIKLKVIGTAAIAVVLCLLISLYANWKSKENIAVFHHITSVNLPNIQVLATMEKSGVLLEAAANMLIGSQYSADSYKEASEQYEKAIKLYSENAKKYESLPFVEGEEVVWKKFQSEFWQVYAQDVKKIIDLSGTGKASDITARDDFAKANWKNIVEKRDKEFDTLINFQENEINLKSGHAIEEANLLSWLVPLILVVAGAISIFLAYLLGAQIAKALLTITNKVKSSSELVENSSTQIAASSEQLSQANVEQAASLQETSSSIEEINSMISANTENARKSSDLSEKSLLTAEKGKKKVDQMIVAIDAINASNSEIVKQIDETNAEIENIVKIINDIGNKTKVINDIVFQTKLLSFNASVEAARAGEQGKGFSVVAEEVGNLAAMSGAAALEITKMLETSTKSVESIVRNSKEKIGKLIVNGQEKVETGTLVANECGEALEEIVQSVSTVSKMIGEISTATQEQAQGVQEITKAVAQLDQVTQENSSTSAQAANAADELSQQAQILSQLVSDLLVNVEGREDKVANLEKVNHNVIPMAKKAPVMKSLKVSNGFPSANDGRFTDV
nr:methyl-accepting chemotaxis protein [Bacteriovorax sp. HI3]